MLTKTCSFVDPHSRIKCGVVLVGSGNTQRCPPHAKLHKAYGSRKRQGDFQGNDIDEMGYVVKVPICSLLR